MAQAKSVIQIDVQDESFKRFQSAFNEYTNALAAMPADWKKVGQHIGDAGKSIEKNLKGAGKAQKDFNKDMRDGLVTAKEFASQAKSIASSFASAALSIAKWVTLGALGGGFGLAGLASNAGNLRRQSQGLGLSTGEVRAAETSLSRYIDPMAALKNIVDAQNDVTKRIVFSATGTSPNGKNALQVLQEMLPKMVASFKAQPESTRYNYANAMHFTDIVSQEDLNRLAHLGKDELPQAMRQMEMMAAQFQADDSVNKGWQDFMVNLHAAGNALEVNLQKNLIRLSEPLQKLMAAIGKVTNDLLSSPDLAKWLNSLSKSIEEFAGYLSSPQFKDDIGEFMESMRKIAGAVMKLADIIGWVYDHTLGLTSLDPDDTPYVSNKNPAVVHSTNKQSAFDFIKNASKERQLQELEASNKLPFGLLDAIWANESSRGKNKGKSSAGAEGDFQLMPDTAKSLGVTDISDFSQSATAAAKMIARLLKKYKGNVERTLEAYNWGEGNLDHYLRGDKSWVGSDGRKHVGVISYETRQYVERAGFTVTINENTGGNVTANVAMQGAR